VDYDCRAVYKKELGPEGFEGASDYRSRADFPISLLLPLYVPESTVPPLTGYKTALDELKLIAESMMLVAPHSGSWLEVGK
jgi:hypothetical protein